VNALFDEAPARYADRRNDYTFIKLQERKRRGDGACSEMDIAARLRLADQRAISLLQLAGVELVLLSLV
jgi:hypothetical protein